MGSCALDSVNGCRLSAIKVHIRLYKMAKLLSILLIVKEVLSEDSNVMVDMRKPYPKSNKFAFQGKLNQRTYGPICLSHLVCPMKDDLKLGHSSGEV